jgi:hypothetical protein
LDFIFHLIFSIIHIIHIIHIISLAQVIATIDVAVVVVRVHARVIAPELPVAFSVLPNSLVVEVVVVNLNTSARRTFVLAVHQVSENPDPRNASLASVAAAIQLVNTNQIQLIIIAVTSVKRATRSFVEHATKKLSYISSMPSTILMISYLKMLSVMNQRMSSIHVLIVVMMISSSIVIMKHAPNLIGIPYLMFYQILYHKTFLL